MSWKGNSQLSTWSSHPLQQETSFPEMDQQSLNLGEPMAYEAFPRDATFCLFTFISSIYLWPSHITSGLRLQMTSTRVCLMQLLRHSSSICLGNQHFLSQKNPPMLNVNSLLLTTFGYSASSFCFCVRSSMHYRLYYMYLRKDNIKSVSS